MHVGSLLEIYTTMFGWAAYDTIYHLFQATGLLLFPFIVMIIKNWSEPLRSQNDKAASLVSQTRVNYDAIAMLAVFMLAVVPIIGLKIDQVHYRVACTDSSGTQVLANATGGSTGTTYDGPLNANYNVKIPTLWYLVISLGSGVNAAISSSFSCFVDINGLDKQLRSLKLKDPVLRKEYMRFARECFIPAKSKFTTAMAGGNHYEYVAKIHWPTWLSAKGHRYADDWTYIGSHFYLQTPGFYKELALNGCDSQPSGCSIKAQKPVDGWPVNQARDHYPQKLIDHPDPANPLYGKPWCDEWWNDPVRGVKTKLLKSIEADKDYISHKIPKAPGESTSEWFIRMAKKAYASIINHFVKYTFSKADYEDMIINNYIARDPPSFSPDHGGVYANVHDKATSADQGLGGSIAGGILGGGIGGKIATMVAENPRLGAAGLFVAAKMVYEQAATISNEIIGFYTDMYIAKKAAPMVQAVLLMMIYMLLLFYMVMSNYDVDATIKMIFIILGIQFFTTLWNFADYLNSQLFVSMFPNSTLLGSIATMGIDRFVLNAVLTLLYVVAPFILLWIMGMAGSKLSQGNLGSFGKQGKTSIGGNVMPSKMPGGRG